MGFNYNMQGQYLINTNDADFFTSKMFETARAGIQHRTSTNTNIKFLDYRKHIYRIRERGESSIHTEGTVLDLRNKGGLYSIYWNQIYLEYVLRAKTVAHRTAVLDIPAVIVTYTETTVLDIRIKAAGTVFYWYRTYSYVPRV